MSDLDDEIFGDKIFDYEEYKAQEFNDKISDDRKFDEECIIQNEKLQYSQSEKNRRKNNPDSTSCNDHVSSSGLVYTPNVSQLSTPSHNHLYDDINSVYNSWNLYLHENYRDSKLSDGYILRINEMIRQVKLISWLCHIKFLSDICDHPLTKAGILSLYLLNDVGSSPQALFEFICKNFKISKDYDIWCLDRTKRYIKGAIILKIFRCIYLQKASVIISTLIFIALCRSLGYFARLVLDIPKINTESEKKRVKALSQVFDPNSQSWILVNFKYLLFGDYQYESVKTPSECKISNKNHVPADSDTCIVKLIYNKMIYIFKAEKIFIYSPDLTVKYAIFSPGAFNLTDLRISPKYLHALYYMLDHSDITYTFLSNKSESNIESCIKNSSKDANKGLYIISCCNFGYFYDLTMLFHEKWYNVINKRNQKFHKWLCDLISKLQLMSLNSHKIGRYKTHVKFLHQLDDNLLSYKINDFRQSNVKSWVVNHPTFILESQLGNRQALSPEAKIAGTLNGENIYYRNDVLQLKSKMGWHREMRRIRPNQRPIKIIKVKRKLSHRFLNKSLLDLAVDTVELFSIDQTEPELVESFADSINSYGNVDLTGNRKVPINCLQISGLYQENIIIAANHSKIDHFPALVSFKYQGVEIRPEIKGIVIKADDRANFINSYLYVLDNTNKHKRDSNIDYWKILFKSLSRHKSDTARRLSGSKLARFINANADFNK